MGRILLIGGAGFGGAVLTKMLLKEGYRVGILDITAPEHAFTLAREITNEEITYIWKSAVDIKSEDVEPYDAVVNLAAQADIPMGFTSPLYTGYNNVMSTISVLEACRGVKLEKFIHPSSGSVYGRHDYLPIDEKHPLTPHNPYAASKAAQELYCMAYYRAYGIPVVIMGHGTVYGPGMRREMFIYKWIKNILLDEPVYLEGGDQTRDPTYSSDAMEAWLTALKARSAGVVGQKFQVTTGVEYTVAAILDEVMKACDHKVEVLSRGYRPGEQGQRESFNASKAADVLGWTPKVSLQLGLHKTVEWAKDDLIHHGLLPLT